MSFMESPLQDIRHLVGKMVSRPGVKNREKGKRKDDGLRLLAVDRVSSEARGSEAPFPRANQPLAGEAFPSSPQLPVIELDIGRLQSQKIVTFDGGDPRSRPYDMLRAQLLRIMDPKGWKVIGVTAPTPNCGTSLTALNLAFSMARQRDLDVLLVELNLRGRRISEYLGLSLANDGVLDLLAQRVSIESAVVAVAAGFRTLSVLPTASAGDPSSFLGSDAGRTLLPRIREGYANHIIVLDLPPILSGDDVLALLPQVDCFLLVTAVGQSKLSEIEQSISILRGSNLVSVVVNKA